MTLRPRSRAISGALTRLTSSIRIGRSSPCSRCSTSSRTSCSKGSGTSKRSSPSKGTSRCEGKEIGGLNGRSSASKQNLAKTKASTELRFHDGGSQYFGNLWFEKQARVVEDKNRTVQSKTPSKIIISIKTGS